MELIKSIWKTSGSLKKSAYLKILTLINTTLIIIFLSVAILDNIQRISAVMPYLSHSEARTDIYHYVFQITVALLAFGIYLFLNIRFYPFVQPWVTSLLLKKPQIKMSINQMKQDYQKGHSKEPITRQETTVTTGVEKDMFGNTKWETNISGNVKVDNSGVPIPKTATTTSQSTTTESRKMNGVKEAYQEASAKGFAYTLRLFFGMLLWLLSWYFSFILGWFVIGLSFTKNSKAS